MTSDDPERPTTAESPPESPPARPVSGSGPPTPSASRPVDPEGRALYECIDTVAERVENGDPVARQVREVLERHIRDQELEIPRMPHVAARILECARRSDASAKDVLALVRADPALAGRLIEMANSAAFAGAQPVFSLQAAIVRLGMVTIGETALETSGAVKSFDKDKRGHMLQRLGKFSLATGFACEAIARDVPGETADGGFLTGIFHAVASPAIVRAIGKLERSGDVPPQSDSRVLGIVEALSVPLTEKIARRWNLPKEAQEAIRLQDLKVRDRRGKPLAHILACGKSIVRELGIGVRPVPIDLATARDFKFLGVTTSAQLVPLREIVHEKMKEIAH